MEEIKKIIEKIGSTFESFKQENDERLKQIEKEKKSDTLLEEKVNKISESLNQLEALKKDIEAKMVVLNRTNSGGVNDDVAQAEYRKGFDQYLRRRNEVGLSELHTKAMATDVGGDGAYLLPNAVTAKVLELMLPVSPIRRLANVQPISTAEYKIVADLDGTEGGWTSERATRTDTATGNVAEVKASAEELYAMPPVTQAMLDDVDFDLESWLARKIANKFTGLENAGFATGTGAGQPKGFCTYPTAATADGSRAFGTIEHVVTGVSGDFAATAKQDVLLDLIYKFKSGMLQGASWAMKGTTISALRKLKDANGLYLWQQSLVAGAPSTLHNYPVEQVDDMPAIGANSLSIALANWSRAYTIIDRFGIRTLRDPYTSKGWVKFYTTKRVGGLIEDSEAIKFIKFSA